MGRLVPALLAGLLMIGAGCDSGGEKRDAQYQRLVGTWEVRDLRQGRITLSQGLNVRLTFRNGGDGRRYRLVRAADGDTSVTQGPVDMLDANTLSMSGGFRRPLAWTFTFREPDDLSDSVRFTLSSGWEGSAQAFLSALGLSGTNQRIEMDLTLR